MRLMLRVRDAPNPAAAPHLSLDVTAKQSTIYPESHSAAKTLAWVPQGLCHALKRCCHVQACLLMQHMCS